ncbi:MAG: ferrous iron transport protein B [Candidatus Marinimicrobia bacterium]|nr:ferrous iron transport protein B [Candidatus Neomarinimicrobiota bacterium]
MIFNRHRHHHREHHGHHACRKIKIAIAGNPNAGKTTIFNYLTGQNQKIGNYPGVTVEKKSGHLFHGRHEIELVDLPGIYSLSAYSLEEIVSRDFVINDKPDVIVDILDSTNLERNLNLLLQFQELGIPVVGALNMSDEAEEKGIQINVEQLSKILAIPLVKTIGTKGIGLKDLMRMAVRVAHGSINTSRRHINYGVEIEDAHHKIIRQLKTDPDFCHQFPSHWMAIKLLENDPDALLKVKQHHRHGEAVLLETQKIIQFIEKHFGDHSDVVVIEQRYGYIHGALQETLKQNQNTTNTTLTEKIDNIMLNKYLGIPIFLLIMYLIYQFTFTLGDPLGLVIEQLFAGLKSVIQKTFAAGIFRDFLTDGIIDGVGGVLVFLPLVVFLFMGLSILEDTGYMARAAFVMDKFFHIFGLHGRSFIPFMVSTGCAVPGVMSARVLSNPKDRLVTILVSPIMMCSAKTPVIAILSAVFFPKNAGLVFWLIWISGWIFAFIFALIFRKTLFAGEQTPFVMELPPYRIPTVRGIFQHMTEKSGEYVKKAGTVILAASVIIWFALNFPKPPENFTSNAEQPETGLSIETLHPSAIEQSYGGKFGKFLEPALRPAGFDWKIGVALFAATAAKEVFISTLGILYGIDEAPETDSETGLQEKIKMDPAYNPLMALGLMFFIMIYIPCIATLAVVKKETGSWKWPAFQAFYTLVAAYLIAVAIYQTGILLGYGV